MPTRNSGTRSLNKRQIGTRFEIIARDFLQHHGLIFIDQNCYFKGGEIDLIMQDGLCWVFVEVRFRRNSHFGSAAATVNSSKQQRLITSAMLWLQRQGLNPETEEYRFDIFAITGQEKQWITHVFGA
ncbi:YraN family protein [Zophobihabitans entericus]|uniref:UPF0102 protein IPMB12_00420 n=1 Tax=Zophobihabitans entericus TaxID=1635327 RepID=A0A6G9IFH2_9GAMM|nr:YraN family protein [Zophobihabitans entericus]